MKKTAGFLVAFLVFLPGLFSAQYSQAQTGHHENQAPQGVTIDDLIGRVRILLVSLSPDGRRVAYLTVKGLAREDSYEVTINLIATDASTRAVVLGQYRLKPD